MSRVEGILDVHDLHIWNISTGIPVLTAHVHIGEDADQTQVLQALEVYVRRIGIKHSTIQICNPMAGEGGSGNGSSGVGGGGGGGHHSHSHSHDEGDCEAGQHYHGHEHEHEHGGGCSGHHH
ncbi:CDF transporter, membrane protein [Monoraphidium neglectum]|uniref:CDF transporter, membrane protein n=1 Tax=Monoraphidium neglectum TaxID=145388 RepID=A0A0D2LR93_9CHLO|nr:CDF transporter, membrane protein [Monoraphidium neglectum]KIY94164.1 CDF transporter, membrane protein [Monoraphidium neglectum]|eukprot:XP_013893184.1 CDF transporter, membrane protein [Monoraphidium neglectum]